MMPHEGIKLLKRELRPSSRLELKSSDEDRIITKLGKCCDAHPGCRQVKKCKRLWDILAGLIPFEKRKVATYSRRRTDGGSWMPKANLVNIQRAIRERAIY